MKTAFIVESAMSIHSLLVVLTAGDISNVVWKK